MLLNCIFNSKNIFYDILLCSAFDCVIELKVKNRFKDRSGYVIIAEKDSETRDKGIKLISQNSLCIQLWS